MNISSEQLFMSEDSLSPDQTIAIATKFARELKPSDVVAFYGELGSGKTFLIKALCDSLGTIQSATSPSFTIMNEYLTEKGLYIYHFDFYRLKNKAELQHIGLDDFFYNDFICFIEWADKINEFLPERRWDVLLHFIQDRPNARKIKILRKN